jgi:hypothetical protein
MDRTLGNPYREEEAMLPEAVVERFFAELWNKQDLAVADEIVAPASAAGRTQ